MSSFIDPGNAGVITFNWGQVRSQGGAGNHVRNWVGNMEFLEQHNNANDQSIGILLHHRTWFRGLRWAFTRTILGPDLGTWTNLVNAITFRLIYKDEGGEVPMFGWTVQQSQPEWYIGSAFASNTLLERGGTLILQIDDQGAPNPTQYCNFWLQAYGDMIR